MSFRIPSLEEARSKQEKSVAQSNLKLSTIPTKRIANPPASSQSITSPPSNGASGNNHNSKIKLSSSKTAVVNPYLKYKKNKQTGTTINSSSYSQNIPGAKKTMNMNTSTSHSTSIVSNPNASTFSQAFHTIQKVKTPSTTKEDQNDDWEKQRALDASILISQLNQDEQSKGNNNSLERNNSARDNHALLQPHILHVSTKQRGNRILNHIRNVPCELSKMIPDYIMGPNRCALFLSCKYHKLNPTYIHRRIAELGTDFELRILLTLVDMEDNASTLLFLNHLCVLNNLTLILSWSEEEAARYLETFKAFEKKDASLIQKREKETYSEQVADVLSTVRSINKTDSQQLLVQFGNFKNVIGASMDELSLCPGIGTKKVKRLHDAFHLPFSRKRRVAHVQENKDVTKKSGD